MTNWPETIRMIMKEEVTTQRRLEAASCVPRSTLRRAIKGEAILRIDQMERLLFTLGYSITVHKTGNASPAVRKPERMTAGAASRPKLIRAVGTGRS